MNRLTAIFRRFDWVLFGSALALTIFGLAVLYSTSLGTGAAAGEFANFRKQLAFAGVGAAVAVAFTLVNYRYLSNFSKVLYVVSVLLLMAVLIMGQTTRGARSWFGFGGFGIQPVEFVKLFLVVFLAKFFSDYARDHRPFLPIAGSGLAFGALFCLVAIQPDFGSAFLLGIIWFSMLLIAGVKRSHLLALAIFAAVVAATAWLLVLQPYQKDRVLAFLDPGRDPLGRGYNVTQSVIAVGSGGFFGRGLGYGSQSQLHFLPERQTDFIFAATAEELGFLGVLLVCGLFAIIFYRCFILAKNARDDFSLFLVLGIAISLAAEVAVNVGGNLRLMPVTGITLPFLSYGGSSLLAKFLTLGVLESVAVRSAR
ncbi:MAG: rod shape-determining protein RodA [Patescibacteria group bacterium]